MNNTIAWQEISEYLDTLKGSDLVGAVGKLERKFGFTNKEANDYILFYMGYSN